ncbi:MAG: dehypoxanthine futalosine cyclase [Planctomycetaceae bacterium]|jgi:cyclic dehypoxanthinyl futalosine synthase|nr:dehypoxanthine futalosine cyclase [Planctomycetaceae bacterium]
MLSYKILRKLENFDRLSFFEGIELLCSDELSVLGYWANEFLGKLHSDKLVRTYNIERNINYTNICVSGCSFCAFCRSVNSADGYVLDDEILFTKIAETVSLGGKQILLQGGLHPLLSFEWYEDLLRRIKVYFPDVNVHGFSPTEVAFFADRFGLSDNEVLLRLRAAGLGSLPGGGAEILVDRVRRELSPNKVSAERWLGICREWHRLGGRGSATMMFGHIETVGERVEHLLRLRDLQDETGGFTSFIPWTFQPNNTRISNIKKVGVWEYLRLLAVSRLFLDNFKTIQSSWVTQGLEIGVLGLSFGADDLGSVMIEENVVAAAGTIHRSNEHEFRQVIKNAGFIAERRNQTIGS